MKIRAFLLGGSAFAISFASIITPSCASTPSAKLKPRIEAGMKLGTERHIGLTEAWIPISQDENSVFYGDMRFMQDNGSNNEGNFGVGYRTYIPESKVVLGAHAWIDRRKTKLGSEFIQATFGGEIMTDRFEARMNGYIPLSGSETHTGPNLGSSTAYMAGTGLFFDTASTVKEIPQGGFDFELGKKIWTPFADVTDTTRLYGGTYRFTGGDAKNMTGWRTRVKTDVNSWLSLGGTWQRDNIRGGQGFLEATLKFGGKATYRDQGLRARLDESPERDIDIVSGSVTTDTGLRKPVVNAAGTSTRVITVDNTATAGGDGSAEKPFNTLTAAQNAMAANDVIYVKSGDGTATGMSNGITITQPGVKLIGTGADFDLGNGVVLKGTGVAPVITNVLPTSGETTGNGIFVTASNVSISGVTVTQATRNGIIILSQNGAFIQNIEIRNIVASKNAARGIWASIQSNGGNMDNLLVSDSQVFENARTFVGTALAIGADFIGTISNARVVNTSVTNNFGGGVGFFSQVNGASLVGSYMQNVTVTGNVQRGVILNDDSNSPFFVDVGGGGLSTGGNQIFGNGTNFSIDLDGGTVQAQYNWWGQSTGPAVGQIANEGACPSCGTAVTTNFLTSAP